MKDRGAEPGKSPSGVQGQNPGQKLTTYYENDRQKHRLLIGQTKNNGIERLGGKPPIGGRPGAWAPSGPLNPALSLIIPHCHCYEIVFTVTCALGFARRIQNKYY